MEKVEYPKWLYHADPAVEALLIVSPQQQEALGAGWADSPDAAAASFMKKTVSKKMNSKDGGDKA